jgi:hypothetical protein
MDFFLGSEVSGPAFSMPTFTFCPFIPPQSTLSRLSILMWDTFFTYNWPFVFWEVLAPLFDCPLSSHRLCFTSVPQMIVSYDQLQTRIPAAKNHTDFTGTRMERVKQKGVVSQKICAHPK